MENFKELYNTLKLGDLAKVTNIYTDYFYNSPINYIQLRTENYCFELNENGTYKIFKNIVDNE